MVCTVYLSVLNMTLVSSAELKLELLQTLINSLCPGTFYNSEHFERGLTTKSMGIFNVMAIVLDWRWIHLS